ncbi:hypothetical protein PoB_002943900 [Plakobranchus ocellatus]|uniref:Uncharacterized protein n=1 Tax=Plakobranchus ocellatus TaxID=259542 RepID=A0AAV4A8Y9_9GAST|nr:hypothetical protein PoB_002943900 [Plakobranchus ocellatus]
MEEEQKEEEKEENQQPPFYRAETNILNKLKLDKQNKLLPEHMWPELLLLCFVQLPAIDICRSATCLAVTHAQECKPHRSIYLGDPVACR